MKNLKIDETSSIFINRKRGESSVNFLLIYFQLQCEKYLSVGFNKKKNY